jgi:phage repressor protein C with HTH and peptisase S24 domain
MCEFANMDDAKRQARDLIQRALDKTGLTPTQLAARAKLAPSTLTRFLNNPAVKHAPSTTTLAKLAQVAGLDFASASARPLPEPNAVFVPDAPPLGPRAAGPVDVPVYGVAEGGQDGAFVINLTDGAIDYAARPLPLLRAQNVFAVRIQGNSMSPLWDNGDLVYCHPGRGYGPDDFVIVQLDGGPGEPPRALFKQFRRQDNGTLVLRQLSPDQEIMVDRADVKQVWRVLHWRELAM